RPPEGNKSRSASEVLSGVRDAENRLGRPCGQTVVSGQGVGFRISTWRDSVVVRRLSNVRIRLARGFRAVRDRTRPPSERGRLARGGGRARARLRATRGWAKTTWGRWEDGPAVGGRTAQGYVRGRPRGTCEDGPGAWARATREHARGRPRTRVEAASGAEKGGFARGRVLARLRAWSQVLGRSRPVVRARGERPRPDLGRRPTEVRRPVRNATR